MVWIAWWEETEVAAGSFLGGRPFFFGWNFRTFLAAKSWKFVHML